MNKKDRYIYPAIFDYDEDGISVSFPDLPGCYTCAQTDEEALRMAKDALGGHMWTREDMGEDIPSPSAVKDIKPSDSQRVVLIEVYMPLIRNALSSKAVKKTLTIPAWMNEAAERNKLNCSQLLQQAIAEAIKRV